MFLKHQKSIFSSLLILVSLIFYQFLSHELPSRKIAQDAEKIYRNRVMEPERLIQDVHKDSKFEQVVKLKNARIVMADYDLIRRDFPHVRDLSNPAIDEWILNQVAYVSMAQSAQTTVNTKIPVTEEFRQAARPPNYGRALVFPMIDPRDNKTAIGLIDVKGSGALNPGQKDHGNGVATLGECVREYLYENLVRDVLDDADVPTKTIASYAVIDAGFGVVHKDGSTSPAGLYLRQAHHRVEDHPGAWLHADQRARLQSIFHRYGIDPNQNVQGTMSGDIFDFGHFVVKDDLPTTLPEKQIPFNLWGYDKSIKPGPEVTDTRWFYSKEDHPWVWSHELADSFANGRASRNDAWTHFQNLAGPARAKLTTFRVKDYALDGYNSSRDVANFLKRMNVEKNVFVIENIKLNLLTKDKMTDALWKNYDTLVELTKSLEFLTYDGDVEKLQHMIIAKAEEVGRGLTAKPFPIEIERLKKKFFIPKKTNLKAMGMANNAAGCVGIATGIIQHSL